MARGTCVERVTQKFRLSRCLFPLCTISLLCAGVPDVIIENVQEQDKPYFIKCILDLVVENETSDYVFAFAMLPNQVCTVPDAKRLIELKDGPLDI